MSSIIFHDFAYFFHLILQNTPCLPGFLLSDPWKIPSVMSRKKTYQHNDQ